jgi:hypothetical protein
MVNGYKGVQLINHRMMVVTYIVWLERLLVVFLHAAMADSDSTGQDQLHIVLTKLNITCDLIQFSIIIRIFGVETIRIGSREIIKVYHLHCIFIRIVSDFTVTLVELSNS